MVRSCSRCGKMINSEIESQTLCLECMEKEEKEFKRIKEFLIEHPLATVFQVVTTLDISIQCIKRFLRENRLEIVEKSNQKNQFLTCQRCGRPISSGYFCPQCATTALNEHVASNDRYEENKYEYRGKTTINYNQKIKRFAS